MSTTQCPALPAEIWLRVLQNLQEEEDLPDLWTSYRHVCTTFKQAVEAIMRENHLRKTWVRFQLGNFWEDGGEDGVDGMVSLNSLFEFLHLSEDKTQATFEIDQTDEKYKPKIRERLQDALENRLIEAPGYEIQIHRDINDGPIPGLSVDYENLQFTCDWREMYTIFYGEEQIFHGLLNKWVKEQEKWTIGLRQKMERGELDMMKMVEQAFDGFASGSEDARKTARRARIRKEYLRLDGTEWDADRDGNERQETKALEMLKDSRIFCSFEEHSDDEDEDVEEDGSSEDYEEGEWEDEEGSDGDEE